MSRTAFAHLERDYGEALERADQHREWLSEWNDHRDQLEPEPFDLDELIRAATARINALIDARIRDAQSRARRDAEHVRRSHAAVWRSDRKQPKESK